MTAPERELHLNLIVLTSGRHDAAWRFRDEPDSFLDVDYYVRLARIAERGTFDALFLADHHGGMTWGGGKRPWHPLDPITLLAAIGAQTDHVGLIATQSALYGDPWTTARRMASLDHITKGRSAWNIVTSYDPSDAELYGFGAASPDRLVRYRQAAEYVEVVTGLWRSFEPDALVGDRATGEFADLAKVHPLDHTGEFYSVRGPLGIPRTPQGAPVLFHAGASTESREFAARWADAMFTIQRTLAGSQEFYADLKARTAAHGRDPEKVLLLPGLYVSVASTEAEARARKQELDETQGIDILLGKLAARVGLPVEELSLDEELPYHLLEPTTAERRAAEGANADVQGLGGPDARIVRPGVANSKVPATRDQLILQARTQRATVRDLLTDSGGHNAIIGGPEQIADHIETWFRERAVDGFNLDIDLQPDGFEAFVDHVVPILRARGIYRHEYPASGLLRDTLGVG